MIHQNWKNNKANKKVVCLHTNAKKYMVDRVLTPGKTYDVINETEDYYFIIDNSGKVGGFYKDYFKLN
mgnify:FL=1